MPTELQQKEYAGKTNGHLDLPSPPQPNPKGGVLKRGMLAAGVGVAGLILGAGIGAVAGGNTKTVVRVPPAQTVTQTVASVKTRIKKVPVVKVRTNTVTQTVTAPARTVTAPSQASSSAPAGRGNGRSSFVGTGSENLGTINVPTDSTLYWTCSSCTATGMMVQSDPNGDFNDISVLQQGTQGQTAVSAGTYKNVQVDADGPFTITIR